MRSRWCIAVVAALVIAPTSLSTAATAFADCGDPGQPACAGSVPTTDQVVAVLARLADPGVPAANKADIVTPGFAPDEAGTIDNHLDRMEAFGGLLPPNFVVTDIESAPANFAGATVRTSGGYKHWTNPRPIVLVNQGGHWQITSDTATAVLDAIWNAPPPVIGGGI